MKNFDYKPPYSTVKKEVWGEILGFLEIKEIFKVLNFCKFFQSCWDRAYVLKQELAMICQFEKNKISSEDPVDCLYEMLQNFLIQQQFPDFKKKEKEEIIKYVIRNINRESFPILGSNLIFDLSDELRFWFMKE